MFYNKGYMSNYKNFRQHLFRFLKDDFRKNKIRFFAETIRLIFGLSATSILALTMPDPNLLAAYIMWEISATCLIYGAWSRGSTGLLLLYSCYFVIDAFGLARLLEII